MRFNFTGTKHVQILKWFATIIPALGTLYATIAMILGLPLGKEVVAICLAVETFIMVLIGAAKPDTEDTE